MSEAPKVRIDKTGDVAVLRLNRPGQGNAFDLSLARAFLAAARVVAEDQTVRCVVLTGTGRYFCVGGDVQAFADSVRPELAIGEIANSLHQGMTWLAEMPKPLVVMVNGPAAGAGLGLAMLGDIVFAAASSHFTMAYTALGLTPDGGSTWLLPRTIGLRRAQEMTLTNRRVGSVEAESMGLVTRVIDDAALESETMDQAFRLAEGPTEAFGRIRRLFIQGSQASLNDQMKSEASAIVSAASCVEGREGIAAFAQKRIARFRLSFD